MIRMSKQSDYGIVLLTQFAARSESTTLTARELAEAAEMSQPSVSKVLKVLARAGFLASHRGVNGGYNLARHPRDISVAEVITATEGGIAMTECVSAPGDCEQEPTCRVRANWRKINDAVVYALSEVTLADMVHPLSHGFVPLDGGSLQMIGTS
jgi:FeS assembly SUF system regulator